MAAMNGRESLTNLADATFCRRAAAHHRAGAGGARRRHRRAGARRARLSAGAGAHLRLRRLHGADHGRAAGRHHGDRGLRGGVARAVAGARRRRPDRRLLSAGDFFARHRPAAGAALGFRPLCRPRRPGRDAGARSTAAGGFAASSSAPKANACGCAAATPQRRSRRSFAADRRHDGSQACSHRRARCRIAAAEQARGAQDDTRRSDADIAATRRTREHRAGASQRVHQPKGD